MVDYVEFDEQKVQEALDAASKHNETFALNRADGSPDFAASGEYSALGGCVSVTVKDHKVCLKLPLGIGNVCIPIPVNIPIGTVAEACLHICTTFGIPTGVKVTVSALGHTVASKSFGKC